MIDPTISRKIGLFGFRLKINLIKLPGIGEYASAAISSIAFNKKAVAIDGNVKRVIARYYEIRGNDKSFEKKILLKLPKEFVPIRKIGLTRKQLWS